MKKRYLLSIALLLFVVLLMGLTPVFLSSKWVREGIVNQINSKGIGRLSIEDCRFGWNKGFVCHQVAFQAANQGYQLNIPEVSGSKGLLALLVTPHDLGTLVLDHPKCIFSPSQAAVETKSKTGAQVSGDSGAQKEKSIVISRAPFWDKYTLQFLVKDAEMEVVSDTGSTIPLINKSSLDAVLSSGTVNFSLALTAADAAGQVTAKGFINLPVRQSAQLETMVAEVNGKIVDLQLKPFAALLPKGTNLPKASGSISADFFVKTSGMNNIHLKGAGALKGLQLAGGFLAGDTPHFDKIILDFEMKQGPEFGFQVPALHIDSDIGTLDLTGNYAGTQSGLTGKGKLALPEIFSRFPHLTRMRPDTKVAKGELDVALNVRQKGSVLEILGDGRIAEFSGRQGAKSFSWKSPVTLNFDGILDSHSGLQVHNADLNASFIHLEGKGELKKFSLHGTANLDQAAKDVGGIFELAWKAGGRLVLDADSKEIGSDHYFIQSSLKIADFSLSQAGRSVLPKHNFVLTTKMDTPRHFPTSVEQAMTLGFDCSTWPGKIHGKFDTLFQKNNELWSHFKGNSAIRLKRLTKILHALKIFVPEDSLTGMMKTEIAGRNEGKRIFIRTLDTQISEFIVRKNGIVFRDPLVHVLFPASITKSKGAGATPALETVIDLAEHSFALHDLAISTDKGRVQADGFTVTNWQKIPGTASLKASGKADLVALTPVLQQSGLLSPEQTLAGKGSFLVDLAATGNDQHKATLQLEVKRPAISSQGKIVFSDQVMSASGAISGGLTAGNLQVEQFSFTSAPLKLAGKGKLQRTGKEPFMSLQGTFTPDYAALIKAAPLLRNSKISASGKQTEKFNLSFPLGKKGLGKLQSMKVVTVLKAATLAGSGVVFHDFEMPVTLQDGKFQGKLSGDLYNTPMTLQPKINFSVTPPLLSLPPKEQVFKDVPLEQPLIDGVLKRIHPLLGELASPKGRVSGRFDTFSWPLAKKSFDKADFSLVLDVGKVTLSADGILRDIFNIVGFDDDIIVLKQSEIVCHGSSGRIQCTPLKMLVADTEISLSGSAGLDSSLDYVLEIPVTKKLVGTEGFRLLEGTTIKVPIRGDSDNAVFDADILSGTIKDLLGQAAKKAVKKEVKKQVKKQVEKLLPGLFDSLIGN